MLAQGQAWKSEGWPSGGGDLGRLIRERDWSAGPLGHSSDWPQSLRMAIDLILPAQAQIVVFWGEDYRAFYNDAWKARVKAAYGADAELTWFDAPVIIQGKAGMNP